MTGDPTHLAFDLRGLRTSNGCSDAFYPPNDPGGIYELKRKPPRLGGLSDLMIGTQDVADLVITRYFAAINQYL